MVTTGQERVGEGVPHDHQPLDQPFRPGRAHVVLPDDFEQAGARHPRDVRPLAEPQDHGRPDDDLEVRPRVLPEVDHRDGRFVAEPEERGQHHEHAQPEPRDRDEEDRQRSGHVVGQAVGPERADEAHGEPHQPRDDERHEGDLGAERPAVQDHVGDLLAPEERLAEAARGDVAEPAQVLDGQRITEPEIGHQLRSIARAELGESLHPEHGHQGIAGQNPEDHEHDQRNADQRARRKSCGNYFCRVR